MVKAGHKPFLVSYLWEGGGVWAVIDAPSADHIRRRYDALVVYDDRPPNITDQEHGFAFEHAHFDLTDDPPIWLKVFMEEED